MASSDLHTRALDGQSQPSPGLGLMSIGGNYGPVDAKDAKALLSRAYEVGCTFWDSADVYGCGQSEKLIGEWLKESGADRSKLFIATKFGLHWNRETGVPSYAAKSDVAYLRQCIEESLERLGTVPDLYYQHRVDPNVKLEDTWAVLEELRKEGKVKALGVSECNVNTLRKIAKIAKLSALQIEYSPWETAIERNGIKDACDELGITIVAYSPVGRGMLTGRWKTWDDMKGDRRATAYPRYSEENFEGNHKLVTALTKIAEQKGISVAQLSIAWVAAQGTIPIPGTSKVKNMEENFKSREVTFTRAELDSIREAMSSHEIKGERYGEQMSKQLGH